VVNTRALLEAAMSLKNTTSNCWTLHVTIERSFGTVDYFGSLMDTAVTMQVTVRSSRALLDTTGHCGVQ
jgi:hypothetical protein